MRVGIGIALAMVFGVATPVGAQTVEASGRTIYPAAFFVPFAPANALQIVARVPGFTLESGDAEVRGFGQAAGNVVINGQRPSSKSDTLDVILARIPASRVARVEVGAGNLFGSEFAGKAQVVNLVLTAGGGVAGTVDAKARRDFTGKLFPEGSVSALVRRGTSTFNGSVAITNANTSEEGTDTLRTLPGGAVFESRRKVNTRQEPTGTVSAGWEYDGGSHRTAHLNGRWVVDRFALDQRNRVVPATGAIRDDFLTQRLDYRSYELGGDVTRPLAGGGIKLIGLATRTHRDAADRSFNRIGPVVTGGVVQTLASHRDETLARLVWNRSDLGGWSVELGGEAALNRLTSDVDLVAVAASGARSRIDLPVDQATVRELRGEGFVNVGRPLSPKLRLDLNLAYETSRLTVRGDAQAERSLAFLKPKATLDWRPGPGWHVQAVVARTVAQLQFEDFISAAELTNDRVNGGNADLLPQRAWETLATVEHTILTDGLVKLELGYNRISLLQDRVPTPEGFDAPGNLGDGTVLTARATFDAPLGSLGIKGGRLNARVSRVDTSVIDPYTLRDRPFSGYNLWSVQGGFRQDRGKFAWGFQLYRSSPTTYYRLNELDRFSNAGPYATAFAEYRPTPKLTLTAGADNAGNVEALRRRTFFAPDRRTLNPSVTELRERNQHVIPYLGLKYSFG